MTPLCPSACFLNDFKTSKFFKLKHFSQTFFFSLFFPFVHKTEPNTLLTMDQAFLYSISEQKFEFRTLSFLSKTLPWFLITSKGFSWLGKERARGFRFWFNLLNWKSGNSTVANGDPSIKFERKFRKLCFSLKLVKQFFFLHRTYSFFPVLLFSFFHYNIKLYNS